MIGQIISHYRILVKLGGGGMGVVYKAQDTRLDRDVALKFLPEDLAYEPQALERFEREAKAASALNHPNICTIYDIGDHDGLQFIAMEFLDGETLKHRISASPLPFDELLELAIQIADALRAAHAQGIVHRDIKPANLFITRQGNAKVLDFGLAKFAPVIEGGLSGIPTATKDTLLTSPGSVVGTVAYMSPEQARGEELDVRTDLFSFGAVLYQMATGRMAFSGNTAAVIHDAILNRAPAPLTQVNSGLPPGLELIVNKALEKDRTLRYQHAADIRTDLQRLKRDSDSGRASAVAPQAGTVAKKSPWSRWAVATGAIVIVGLAVGAWMFFSPSRHALTEKDTIVLADFTNTTGDSVFDGTLRQGLLAQLQQSPFLSITSDERMRELLKMMGQPPDARITPQLARDICLRSGSKVYVGGSIANLGTSYVIGLNVVNCETSDSFVNDQVQASAKEDVLNALGAGAAKLRQKLGESLNSVKKFDTPLAEATTSSLEALKAYSSATRNVSPSESIPLYRRALELDSNFAMAYRNLAGAYSNLGEVAQAADNMTKAYRLRDHLAELDKLKIECGYETFVTGNLEKAARCNEAQAQIYPRNANAPCDLGWIYPGLGQYDKALVQAKECVRLSPDEVISWSNLASSFANLNRLKEAHRSADEARAHGHDSPTFHILQYQLAFLENDRGRMEIEAKWFESNAALQDVFLALQADTAAYFGHLTKARELSERAVTLAKHAGETETAAGYEAASALREALFRNVPLARVQTNAARGLSKGRDVQAAVALAASFMGDTRMAQTIAEDLARQFPEDTCVQYIYLPTIRGQLSIALKDGLKAIEALKPARPFDLAAASSTFAPIMYSLYVRGTAYLTINRGSEAVVEFQTILEHQAILGSEPIGALAHLGLARAYALQGDTVKALAAYKNFFTLWKDADPDVPILKVAKAEYAELQ